MNGTERLNYLCRLKDGWYDGQGKAITDEAKRTANSIVTLLCALECNGLAIFPTIEGGIQFENGDITLTVGADGIITICKEKD